MEEPVVVPVSECQADPIFISLEVVTYMLTVVRPAVLPAGSQHQVTHAVVMAETVAVVPVPVLVETVEPVEPAVAEVPVQAVLIMQQTAVTVALELAVVMYMYMVEQN